MTVKKDFLHLLVKQPFFPITPHNYCPEQIFEDWLIGNYDPTILRD